MQPWPYLQPNDVIDVVAPGYGTSPSILDDIAGFIRTLGFTPRIPKDLLGEDLFCSNDDAARFRHVQNAFLSPDSKAVWCIKGGYGTTRIMPQFWQMPKSSTAKLLLGFSDITALHSMVNQHWGWHSVHAPVLWQLAMGKISEESVAALKALLLGKNSELQYEITPLNTVPEHISGMMRGGNMMILQHSIGTVWQSQLRGAVVMMEDIDERPYAVDRTLAHMQQSGFLDGVAALVFADFSHDDPNFDHQQMNRVFTRFAETASTPVYRIQHIGHEKDNLPLPLGVMAQIRGNQLILPAGGV